MDREIILKIEDEETHVGYVSDFLSPRDEGVELASLLFDRIREAIISLDIDSFETDRIVIAIK